MSANRNRSSKIKVIHEEANTRKAAGKLAMRDKDEAAVKTGDTWG